MVNWAGKNFPIHIKIVCLQKTLILKKGDHSEKVETVDHFKVRITLVVLPTFHIGLRPFTEITKLHVYKEMGCGGWETKRNYFKFGNWPSFSINCSFNFTIVHDFKSIFIDYYYILTSKLTIVYNYYLKNST